MKIAPVYSNLYKISTPLPSFKSETVYQDSKIIEKDILTLSGQKGLFSNPISPNQNILGVNLTRANEKTIELTSRYGNKTGTINFNPNAVQPKMSIQAGSFQPIVELKDDELGLTLLMARGSSLDGKNLKINYKELAKPNIPFAGNNLVVTTGYKPEKTRAVVNEYFARNKAAKDEKSKYADLLKQEYTIVGLGGGYGSRLKPISDLEGNNKPSTKYPGSEKSLFAVSVLDTASSANKIDSVQFINDPQDNLSGTAGVIIKGIKNGAIPLDKPLVLLTGDTFNNIDLAKALYEFEQSENTGIAMILHEVSAEDLSGSAPVRFDNEKNINALFPKIDADNYSEIMPKAKVGGKIYAGTNIAVVHPEILNILQDYGDKNGKAEFVEFLGLMFNVLNKTDESLEYKYPNDLKSENLKVGDLTYYDGTPKPIYGNTDRALKLKAIVATTEGAKSDWADVGTIEDYIETIRQIKQAEVLPGLSQSFIKSVKNHVDDNGVIYMNTAAKDKVEKFKQKYGIDSISGNVIAHSSKKSENISFRGFFSTKTKPPQSSNAYKANPTTIYLLTNTPEKAQSFVERAVQNPGDAKKVVNELIRQYGFPAFLKWYLDPKGYYGAYEKHMDKFYEEAGSVDELLKYQPNWSPWKLEEKDWLCDNPQYKGYSKGYIKQQFDNSCEGLREYPLEIGSLPSEFDNKTVYKDIISRLKAYDIKSDTFRIGGENYSVKRLKGGELNDKFVYLVQADGKKFIVKFDRINLEDASNVDGRKLSNYEKKSVRKNKYLAADSVFLNACVNRYLELNGCKNIPKLLYYNHETHSSIYEYIDDVDGDKFQKGLIDEEYMGMDEINSAYGELSKLGIYLNDAAIKNTLKTKDGTSKIVDLGHCSFINPLKPGVKHYNVELSNINGPDLRNVYAGMLLSLGISQ